MQYPESSAGTHVYVPCQLQKSPKFHHNQFDVVQTIQKYVREQSPVHGMVFPRMILAMQKIIEVYYNVPPEGGRKGIR